MGKKYEPLGVFLRRWKRKNLKLDRIELSFADVERIIGAPLPKNATSRQWWSDLHGTQTPQIQCEAWLNAGFKALLIEGRELVQFHKL